MESAISPKRSGSSLIGNVGSPARSPASMNDGFSGKFMIYWERSRAIQTEPETEMPSFPDDLSSLGFISDGSPFVNNVVTQESKSPSDSHDFVNGYQPNLINPYEEQNTGFGNLGLLQGRYQYDWNHDRSYHARTNPVPVNPSRHYGFLPRTALFPSYGAFVLQDNPARTSVNYNNVGQNPFFMRSSGGNTNHCTGGVYSMMGNNLHNQGFKFKCQMKELLLNGSIDPLKAAMNPEYSQCLLRLLAGGDVEITNNILHGVLRSVFDLMEDKYGKLLFQMLLKICNDRQKQKIVYKVIRPRNKLVKTAKTLYGRHSVWKLIKSVKGSPMLHDVTSALSSGIFDLMINPTGFHLVEDCLCYLNYEDNKFIYRAAWEHCDILARDSHGYLSLMRCISNSEEPYTLQILKKITEDSLDLAKDDWGNFVIQHVLSLHDLDVTERICSRLKEHLLVLAMDKFGSYVVEKCIQSSSGQQLLQVLASCGEEKIEEIALDQYGNYVLQSALKSGKDMELQYVLIHAIKQASEKLRYHPNGR